MKAFPEARGSLIYFSSFRKSRQLRPHGQPAVVCRYDIASYFVTLLCKLFDTFDLFTC
jgi:hypothetical protein